MMRDVQTDEQTPRPLAGARAWLITTGMAGMDVQTQGVADALGLDYEMKRVDPQGIWKFGAPWAPVAPAERFGKPGAQFAPPWPDIAISLGRGGVPYMRALRRGAGAATFTVVMQDPKTGLGTADMIWVPDHDRLRGANVFTTLTAPHSFTARRLAELRHTMPPAIAALARPRVGVILGGKNAVYKFRDEDDVRLAQSLASLGRLGASFLITPSRRTHERLARTVDEATRAFPRIFWDGSGRQPLRRFPRARRPLRRHRRQRQHDGRGVRYGQARARVHAVAAARQSSAASTRRSKRAVPRGRCPTAQRHSRSGATSRCIPSTRSRARSSDAGA